MELVEIIDLIINVVMNPIILLCYVVLLHKCLEFEIFKIGKVLTIVIVLLLGIIQGVVYQYEIYIIYPVPYLLLFWYTYVITKRKKIFNAIVVYGTVCAMITFLQGISMWLSQMIIKDTLLERMIDRFRFISNDVQWIENDIFFVIDNILSTLLVLVALKFPLSLFLEWIEEKKILQYVTFIPTFMMLVYTYKDFKLVDYVIFLLLIVVFIGFVHIVKILFRGKGKVIKSVLGLREKENIEYVEVYAEQKEKKERIKREKEQG